MATKRLTKEYAALMKSPVDRVSARPLETNILHWHFLIYPPDGELYEGGQYHGKLIFPKDYPFKPPSVIMMTPSGRFRTNERLCLSMSDYHPETWNPAWSASTVVIGLLSFMLTDEITVGGIVTPDEEKIRLAKASRLFNSKNKIAQELFGEEVACSEASEAVAEDAADAAEDAGDALHKGAVVELKDLSAVVLNGVVGTITGDLDSANYDPPRWPVKLPNGEVKAIRSQNLALKPVEVVPPGTPAVAEEPKPATATATANHGTDIAGEPPKKVKVGPNKPCPCGSGKKYKKCCMIAKK